jgi:hypothetical protein
VLFINVFVLKRKNKRVIEKIVIKQSYVSKNFRGSKYNLIKENVRFTTPIQQLHNPSHEGGSHALGPTLM